MSLLGLYNRLSGHAGQLDRMIQALGLRSAIDTLPDSGNVLRRAADRCLACKHSEQCVAWLDANSKADEAPEYCRNRDLFQRVARGRERTLPLKASPKPSVPPRLIIWRRLLALFAPAQPRARKN